MAPVPLTLGEGFFHRMWFGARDAASRVGGTGHADTAPHSDMLFMAIFWISVVSFVFLMALMFLFTWQYRRRPGVPIQRSPAHNTPLELVWTVLPLIVLVWIFFEGFWGYVRGQTGGAMPEEISLTAQKWSWSMTYSNGAASPEVVPVGAAEVPRFVAPAGVPVLLKMHSLDVIHSFWVPDFRWKQDVFPNRYTAFAFETPSLDKVDPALLRTDKHPDGEEYQYIEHYIFCAEFCGDAHSEMAAVMRVVAPKHYAKILADWASPKGEPWEQGQFWWKAKGCISCHSIDGSAKTGPTWKNMYGYEAQFEGGGTALRDENYIRESVYVPAAKIVKGFPPNMVSFQGQVNQEQLDALIAFMKHLSDKGPKPLDPGAAPEGEAPAGGG
jgi:cytochrome c oxidase subunit 2